MDFQNMNEDKVEPAASSDPVAMQEELDFPELIGLIRKMMFVSGETAEPSAETTSMIEEIVHTQVVEMVRSQTPI